MLQDEHRATHGSTLAAGNDEGDLDHRDIVWNGEPHEPHLFPARSEYQRRRDRIKAWIAHQPLTHRLLDVALLGALPGLGAYARFFAPHTLETTVHTVPVVDLPRELEGLRIAHLSDLHAGKNVPIPFLRRGIQLVNECRPDLVALTGDYLQWDEGYVDVVAKLLSGLEAPLGTYAVLGNHDYGLNSPGGPRMLDRATGRLVIAMERVGVRVLRNQSTSIAVEGASLQLIGVDDLWSGESDPETAFANVPEASPRLFLCHNPDGFGFGRRHRFDLMLCGHTHGAQVRLPVGPPPLLPIRDQRLLAGFYGRRGSWVYVNRGVGYIWRVRLNSAPEIACHTLRRERWAGQRPYGFRHRRERWRA